MSSPDSSGLWALGPVTSKPLDGRNMLMLRRDNGAVAAVDAQWHPFLQQLQFFRTIQGHAQAIAAANPPLRGRENLLQSGLRTLIPTGVFVSADEFLESLDTVSSNREPATLVVTTCDRPSCLERLLRSLSDMRERFGGDWACDVIDDSRTEASQKRNAELVAETARHFPVSYFGRGEQKAFIDRLCAAVPGAGEHLPWLLSSLHPTNEGEATYGVPVNLAFLRHAGSRIVLVDDDTVARAWVRPDRKNGVKFDNTDEMPWMLSSVDDAPRKLKPFDADPMGAHVASLGTGLRQVLSEYGGAGPVGSNLAGAKYPDVARLAAASRVRYTHNGLVGDPGTVSDLTLFMPGNRFIETDAIDDRRYARFRKTPRCVVSALPQAALRSTIRFQRATFAGVDLDPYMGPVLPTGRGEDSMIGAMTKFLFPRDFGLKLPFGLEHRPEPPREWSLAPEIFTYQPTAIEMATNRLPATVLPYDHDPADKMAVYSETLLSDLSRDGGRVIVDTINARFREILADHIGNLNRALQTTPKGCLAWKGDVGAVVNYITESLRKPLPESEAVTAGKLELLSRYARAIPLWNQAFAYCCENRSTRT